MTYHIVYSLAWLVALLPYRALYALSDGLYLLVYHIIRYRRKVVGKNLSTSFPEKSNAEIKTIERQFYHWLCDYAVETIKLLHVSDDELLRHLEFRGCDEVEKYMDKGLSVAWMLGHYCNWEYLSATALGMKRWGILKDEVRFEERGKATGRRPTVGNERREESRAVMGLIYKPLRNKAMDRLFLKIRQSHYGTCVARNDILRKLVQLRQESRLSIFGYIADQGPKWENIHLWLDFLNHDTPVFTGSERIIRKMRQPVFYIDMERPERGRYVCTAHLITEHPEQMEEHELTRRYFQLLEQSIRRAPQYYLWSHKRWKRQRELTIDNRGDEDRIRR